MRKIGLTNKLNKKEKEYTLEIIILKTRSTFSDKNTAIKHVDKNRN